MNRFQRTADLTCCVYASPRFVHVDLAMTLQSNEEVIEELTRDLENSCVKADEGTESKNAANDSWDIADKEQDNDSVQNADPSDDAIEDLLKDRDLSLSETEQEVRLLFYPSVYYYTIIIIIIIL